MFRRILALALCLAAFSAGATTTNTAQIQLYCLSVRVEPGTASQFGLTYKLTFSSASLSAPNHELYPIFEDDVTHASGFLLEGTDFPDPIVGELAIEVPEQLDSNTNGVPDFYEVAVAVPSTKGTGFWNSDAGSGDLTVTWQRAAGEHRGTARIQLTSDEFGNLPEFTHAFEIIEYAGTMQYVPSADPVRATVDLHRKKVETSTLKGPLIITREPTNHLHQFAIGETTLTNQAGLKVPVSLGDVEKDPDYPVSYFGAFALLNGDPTTPEPDYELFYIGVDDHNDADRDGIPDLTDDPEAGSSLGIARDGDKFRLLLIGEKGSTYRLERAPILKTDAWVLDQSLTLTNTNHVITVPAFSPSAGFWRLAKP